MTPVVRKVLVPWSLPIILGSVRPDLILLDLSMPKINGRQFLRRLRLDPRCPSTPVLLVSGSAGSAAGPWRANRHLLGRLAKARFGLSERVNRVALADFHVRSAEGTPSEPQLPPGR
jgi:CheY-like chemotaxis protein